MDIRREMEWEEKVGDVICTTFDCSLLLWLLLWLLLLFVDDGSAMEMYSAHSSFVKKLSMVNTGGSLWSILIFHFGVFYFDLPFSLF